MQNEKNLTGHSLCLSILKKLLIRSHGNLSIKHFSSLDTAVIVFTGYNFSTQILNHMSSNLDISQSLLPFLIVAEILALLIKINPEIIEITINRKEFKLTQFADDNTLLLDGSERSLQSALNTLEIFGTFSGLKINKEKTKNCLDSQTKLKEQLYVPITCKEV